MEMQTVYGPDIRRPLFAVRIRIIAQRERTALFCLTACIHPAVMFCDESFTTSSLCAFLFLPRSFRHVYVLSLYSRTEEILFSQFLTFQKT
jgi:hypothetical protein